MKLIKCTCQTCNQHIEFDAQELGRATNCPHCGMETLLFGPSTPPPLKRVPNHKRNWIISIIAIITLLVVLLSGRTMLLNASALAAGGVLSVILSLVVVVLVVIIVLLWIIFPVFVYFGMQRMEALLKQIATNTAH